jgi:hypothetical protein
MARRRAFAPARVSFDRVEEVAFFIGPKCSKRIDPVQQKLFYSVGYD